MQTVEVVIKIPEEYYKNVKYGRSGDVLINNAIKNGTVLPKGHGKIIDVDQFYKAFKEYLLYPSERKSFSFADLEAILNVFTPTIIEAESEE